MTENNNTKQSHLKRDKCDFKQNSWSKRKKTDSICGDQTFMEFGTHTK